MRSFIFWTLAAVFTFIALLGFSSKASAQIDTWTKKADMPTARWSLSTSVVNGKIYAIGGWGGSKSLSTVEEYDPVTDTWTKKADMLTPRGYLATSAVNGKVYAIGGSDFVDGKVVYLPTVEEYDTMTDTWTKKADMLTPRFAHSISVVNGKIYVIGGWIEWAISTVEEYDPAMDTWTKKADMLTPRGYLATSAPAVNGKIYVIGGDRYGGLVFQLWKNMTQLRIPGRRKPTCQPQERF
jgi:N-acetylneuraminic acid mutarotase